MKIFTKGILARRKILLLFLLAILLPSLVVGYLSFRTFSEKQQALQNFLESNLWISGESALKEIEGALLDLERESLKKETFIDLIRSDSTPQSLSEFFRASEKLGGRPFLLENGLNIVFPRVFREESAPGVRKEDLTDTPFSRALQTAENLEFNRRDYSGALEGYRRCLSVATTDRQNAAALEAMGRCLLALQNYDGAFETYAGLSEEYDRILNDAGHPFGITAVLRLYEIGKVSAKKEMDITLLLKAYENLKNGEYPISLSVYEFFLSEIQSILDIEMKNDEFKKMQKSYEEIKSMNSPYFETLQFIEYLKSEVIPRIREGRSLKPMEEGSQTERFLSVADENYRLVSCREISGIPGEESYYSGICWDLDSQKTALFLNVLKDVEKKAKLTLWIIDDKGRNIITGMEEPVSDEALSLSFRQFPLPWSLVVTQPVLDDVIHATRRDNIFYGILLGFVVILMVFGAVLIARDISRETETTRLKTEFVHHASHELKTPLTLIRLYGETLQRKKNLSESEKDEAYEIITKESERLSHLINNVLDFSRIEMGKKEFEFKKGDLAGLIEETLESYRYHLEKKEFSIHKDISAGLPPMMFDAEGISSILINLLSNAIKFSPITKEVSVRLFQKDEHAVLQVEDKGIGIPSREISRVFEKFYRSGDVKAADTKGSGLGLTLVKHITEAHRGRIVVHSEPGRGSVFSIFFPLNIPKGDE